MYLVQAGFIAIPVFQTGSTWQTEVDLLGKNGRRDEVFVSLPRCGAHLAEGIVKETDKLACLVLFLLFQFHSTVRAHLCTAHGKRQQSETTC